MATIEKRGNSYLIRCSSGYDITGKQIRKSMTWKIPDGMSAAKAEKEAKRQAVLFEENVRNGEVLSGKIKFKAFSEQWMQDYAKLNLRPRTLARYREILEKVNMSLGHIELDKLRPQHLMNYYKKLREPVIINKYLPKQDIRKLLKENGITQASIIDNSILTKHSLNKICNGQAVLFDNAQRIATCLNMNLENLFSVIKEEHVLNESTILYYHRVISSVLSWAVKWQVIASNPASRVQPPKASKKEAIYLDEVQAQELLEKLEAAPIQYRTAIEILLFTGMRRGELLGLQWNDVDFDNATISINRSILYHSDYGVFQDDTKNTTSSRVIKTSAPVLQILNKYKLWQTEQRLKVGSQWHDEGWIFTTWNGKPQHPDTLSGWFKNFVLENDLPPIHLHSLRHTNATLLIASGTNLQTVAKRLGHANTTTTSKVYSHAIASADAVAAETLDNILLPKQANA